MTSIKPLELTPHPLNEKLYGVLERNIDEHLRDSIKEHGILVPLTITKDNVIISGHSRWFWACRFDLPTVPIIVCNAKTEDQIEELIVHSNRQRVKTTEQIGREGKVLTRIESARAKARQEAALKKGDKKPDPVTQEVAERGEARKLAADALGVSHTTLKKVTVVVDKIDELEAAGETEQAADLRNTVNKKGGVSEAHRQATGTQPTPKPPQPKPIPKQEDTEFLEEAETQQLNKLKIEWKQKCAGLWKKSSEYTRSAFLEWIDA
jgi:ParB-like chromosome segregation protein Spo0J